MKKLLLFSLIFWLSATYAISQINSKPYKDCNSAYTVTSKNKLTVVENGGAGANTNEVPDPSCFSNGLGGGQSVEMSSCLFKMTCVQNGSLIFTITPAKQEDDIDFLVFETSSNCNEKSIIRCVAAGDSKFPSPCMGPTGLNFGATDTEESSGCGAGKDNFVKALSMEIGKTYYICVNDFTSAEAQYDITFDGTAMLTTALSADEVDTADFTIFPSVNNLPFFDIRSKNGRFENTQIEVFSLEGRQVLTEKIYNENQRIELPNSISNGVFLIKILADKQIFYKKFVCQK